MKKKLLIIAGVILAMFAAAIVVLVLSLNGIVRRAVASNATQSLGVETTVGGALVSPLGGSLGLSDFEIASPSGFTSPKMFSLGDLSVNAHIGQLFGTPVRISSIQIDKPRLILEQAGGKLNVMVLKQNLTTGKSPAPADPSKKPTLLVIDHLVLGEAKVTLNPGVPGVKPYELTLPSVTLDNLGNADGHAAGEEIGQIVVEIVSALAAKAADSDQVPPQLRELLHLNIGELTDKLTDQVKDQLQQQTGIDLGGLMGEKKKKPAPTK